jgi:hypothetical protein
MAAEDRVEIARAKERPADVAARHRLLRAIGYKL